jgi:hypothetical protein
MRSHKTTFGAVLLATSLIGGSALAQTNTNSGTRSPDEQDITKQQQQPIPQSPNANGNSGMNMPAQPGVDQRTQSPNASPPATTGQGNNSGRAAPDEQDESKK